MQLQSTTQCHQGCTCEQDGFTVDIYIYIYVWMCVCVFVRIYNILNVLHFEFGCGGLPSNPRNFGLGCPNRSRIGSSSCCCGLAMSNCCNFSGQQSESVTALQGWASLVSEGMLKKDECSSGKAARATKTVRWSAVQLGMVFSWVGLRPPLSFRVPPGTAK